MKSLTESQSYQREAVELYIEFLKRTAELRHLKLLLSLMNTLRTNSPQKLSVDSCTKNIVRKSRVYVVRQSKEAFHTDCLQVTVKNDWGYVIVWALFLGNSQGQ